MKALEQEDFGLWGTIESLIGLGRFPETGNILDILLLTFPLREWFGVGLDHNAKILIILLGNGMCGYVLARCFTNFWMVSLAAGSIAIVNPLVIQDINKLGLRQTLLWWLLLFPALLKVLADRDRIGWYAVGLCFH